MAGSGPVARDPPAALDRRVNLKPVDIKGLRQQARAANEDQPAVRDAHRVRELSMSNSTTRSGRAQASRHICAASAAHFVAHGGDHQQVSPSGATTGRRGMPRPPPAPAPSSASPGRRHLLQPQRRSEQMTPPGVHAPPRLPVGVSQITVAEPPATSTRFSWLPRRTRGCGRQATRRMSPRPRYPARYAPRGRRRRARTALCRPCR